MGIVALRGVEVFGHIGVEAHERRLGRKFLIDIDVKTSLKEAGKSDSISQIINYAEIAEIIHEEIEKEYKLLEAAAYNICKSIKERFDNTESIKVRIYKNAPFMKGNIKASMIEFDYPDDF